MGNTESSVPGRPVREPEADVPEIEGRKARRISVAAIPLTNGAYALIDFEDIPLVAPYKWTLERNRGDRGGGGRQYAYGWVNRKKVRMHRLIAGNPKGKVVDHLNGDGLDNRRANLKNCSRRENNRNRRAYGFSKYVGVSKKSKKWVSKVYSGRYTHVYLGLYAYEEAAAMARDIYLIESGTENPRLNFPLPFYDNVDMEGLKKSIGYRGQTDDDDTDLPF